MMRCFAILCLFLFSGFVSAEEVARIALAVPLTGDVAAMGQGMKNAARMAIEEANDSGRLKGIRLELWALDDRADPKEAVNVASQIVSDPRVVAAVGHLNSGCSIPASEVYHNYGLLNITPAASNPKLTRQGFENIFRVVPTDDVQGAFAGDLIFSKMKLRKVSVIHDKTAYGQGLAEEFQGAFVKNGGAVTSFHGIAQGEKDFRALLTRIQSEKPHALYFGGLYTEAALISRQAKEMGLKVPFITGDGAMSPEYVKIGGPIVEGDVATMLGVPAERLPKAREFTQRYRKKYPNVEPQPYDHYTYETVNMVIEAIFKSGTNKKALIEAMKKMRYTGLLGETRFDRRGDTLNRQISVYKVKGGRFVLSD